MTALPYIQDRRDGNIYRPGDIKNMEKNALNVCEPSGLDDNKARTERAKAVRAIVTCCWSRRCRLVATKQRKQLTSPLPWPLCFDCKVAWYLLGPGRTSSRVPGGEGRANLWSRLCFAAALIPLPCCPRYASLRELSRSIRKAPGMLSQGEQSDVTRLPYCMC